MKIMIVNLDEIVNEAESKGFEVCYIDKGPEYDRGLLNYHDAAKALKYDAVILETSQNDAEEFRIMMAKLNEAMDSSKQKNNMLICWCMWNDFWRNNGGIYQITTIDKSFDLSDINEASHPSFDGLDAVCEQLKSLGEKQIEGCQKTKTN